MKTEIIVLITSILGGTSFLGIIGGLLARAANNRAWLRDFLQRLYTTKRAVVLSVNQTHVDAVKARKTPESVGGVVLTKEEAIEAMRIALQRFKDMVGIGALERALDLMGLPNHSDAVDTYLMNWLEGEIKEVSIDEAAANATPKAAVAVVEAVRRSSEFPAVPTRDLKAPRG